MSTNDPITTQRKTTPPGEESLLNRDAADLVSLLATNEHRWPAWEALQRLGAEAIPAVRAGLGDGRWQVRRWCTAFLDHNGGPESRPWVLPLLHDPKSKVRFMAVHTLACDRCAGGENPIDPVPHLIDRLWHDESIRVRRMALIMLVQQAPDRRVEPICRQVIERETDPKLLRHANWGLERFRQGEPPGQR